MADRGGEVLLVGGDDDIPLDGVMRDQSTLQGLAPCNAFGVLSGEVVHRFKESPHPIGYGV